MNGIQREANDNHMVMFYLAGFVFVSLSCFSEIKQ